MNGVRIVAILELLKGAIVLFVGCGLISLMNRDAGEYAANLVRHLHLNPASRFPQAIMQMARNITTTQLWIFASLAIFDAVLRGVIAYGLWKGLRWAEWLGVAAAGIYIPIEIYEMARHLTWLKTVTLITNVIVVIYLGYVIYRTDRQKHHGDIPTERRPADITS